MMENWMAFRRLAREHWAVFGLIGLNVVVALVSLGVPVDVLVNFKCVPERVLAAWEGLTSGGFSSGDFSVFATLLTYAFLHAGWEHLFFNLLYLWVFAFLVGELIGQGVGGCGLRCDGDRRRDLLRHLRGSE